MFTLLNLLMGFAAMLAAAESDFSLAALAVLLAATFDALDGISARLTGSVSEFGAELDSLCDVVSFGAAPSFMLYKAFFEQYPEIGILPASFPLLAGAVRLARFNVKQATFEDKEYFVGLPIPASALTLISFVVFYGDGSIIPEKLLPATAIAVTCISSLAMVSRIRYPNLPRPSWNRIKKKPVFFVIFAGAIVATIASKGVFAFPIMTVFIVYYAAKRFILWLVTDSEPEEEIDESEAEESESYDIF